MEETGTLLVDVELSHPFGNPNYTGFDVRGIAMFDATSAFPMLHTIPETRSSLTTP